ncbi:MAG: threonine/serine exporter [Clostridiales bacterium]|nr:threonine/serine exporter [Clostridiales bacterium]
MILQILYGCLATIGFGILFDIPKKLIKEVGLSGGVGWGGYIIIMNLYASPVAATFVASVLIGIMGEYFARSTKSPVTMFTIPAIMPLVPGITSYRAIKALIDGENKAALELGILTIGIAIAIASGLIIVISLFRIKKQRL